MKNITYLYDSFLRIIYIHGVIYNDIFLKGIVMVDRFCSVKNCCSECDLLVVCARQAAICAAVGCAPEVPEMLLDTRA